jgi:TolB-like protein
MKMMKMKKLTVLLAMTLAASMNLWAQQLTVAVSVFEARGGMAASDGEAITELVMAELVAEKTLKVIDRNNFDKIVAEMKFQQTDFANKERVVQLGKALGANSLIQGSVSVLGGQTIITCTITDMNTVQIISSSRLSVKSADEIFDKITPFVKDLIAHLPKAAPVSTGIAIEVSTKHGGVLYFQGQEVATLWDNETHAIPIEKPGTYTVKMVFADGEASQSVAVASRGTVKVEFLYYTGSPGPAGGIVFYDKGNKNDGWQYLEAAPPSTEFQASWSDAITRCNNLVFGGFDNWVLPDKGQLDLMYKNLKQKGLGGFSNNWYRSSSQDDNSYAWNQNFGDGRQANYTKSSTGSVRAVRAF